MLIDFTVENYRSIKGPVTLSAVAQGRKAGTVPKGKGRPRIKPDHEIAPGYAVEGWGFELLPVLAIFGANASGKSNVVRALDDFLAFITSLGSSKFYFDKFIPFKLDSESSTAPTRFEMRVLIERKIYTYSISLNREHILSERLEYALVTSKRNRRLFHRDWNDHSKNFEWKNGEDFRGAHTKLEAHINGQDPFLTMSLFFEIKATQALAIWLKSRKAGVSYLGDDSVSSIMHGIVKDKSRKEKVLEIIRLFDTGITDIEVVQDGSKVSNSLSILVDSRGMDIYACHDTEAGKVIWPFEEESTGTQQLLAFAYRIDNALANSTLTVIDELDSHLHSNITHAIVKMFQSSKTNPSRAQLIFTSHDSTLQRDNLLRRDQIWFTQKRNDGSTELYSLSDLKVRNDLAIDKAYLDGRFGAVPFLPNDEELISLSEG
jgi:uncharacterized protein